MEKAPLSWLRKVSDHLKECDQTPLFGQIPSFNWDRFATGLQTRLSLSNLSLRPQASQWRQGDTLQENLGLNPIAIPLKIGSLEGTAFWMMAKENVTKITGWMLNRQMKSRPFSSEALTTGFYRYLALEVLDTLSKIPPFDHTSILLGEPLELPEISAFCIDVEVQFESQICWGRLAIEPQLQSSLAKAYTNTSPKILLSQMTQSLELTLGVKVGATTLKQEEWETVKEGDFLVLDQNGYDPRKNQGAAYLMLGSLPLFQVKIKQNKIQLVDYPSAYQEDAMIEEGQPEESLNLPEDVESYIPIKDLPIQLTVELSRIRLPLEKLLQLSPGNLIELPIHPEQGVKLTVNGAVVAKGELVHLGETLGVRILDL